MIILHGSLRYLYLNLMQLFYVFLKVQNARTMPLMGWDRICTLLPHVLMRKKAYKKFNHQPHFVPSPLGHTNHKIQPHENDVNKKYQPHESFCFQKRKKAQKEFCLCDQ